MKEHRICKECEIHHYENCETCFGFGIYSIQPGDIVSAHEAIEKEYNRKVLKCPECGSNEKGCSNGNT